MRDGIKKFFSIEDNKFRREMKREAKMDLNIESYKADSLI